MSDDTFDLEPLDHIIDRLAAKISGSCTNSLDAILTNAENVSEALKELEPHGKRARRQLRKRANLSQPMMAKLEAIGRHSQLFRSKAYNLPPSMSTLYALTCLPEEEMRNKIEMDLRAVSRSKLVNFASHSPPSPSTVWLLSVFTQTDLDDEKKLELIQEISANVMNVAERHAVKISVPKTSVTEEELARRYQTEANREMAKDGKVVFNKARELIKARYNEYRAQLDKVMADRRFTDAFGVPFQEALTYDDPLQLLDEADQSSDHFNDECRAYYAIYRQSRVRGSSRATPANVSVAA